MKLKNKLLPLVGVGAACAAVTPIALTSCTTNGNLVDLTAKYNSKYQPLDNGGIAWTTSQAVDTYFQKVKENPDILADDFYWSNALYNALYGTAKTKQRYDGNFDTYVDLIGKVSEPQLGAALETATPVRLTMSPESTQRDVKEKLINKAIDLIKDGGSPGYYYGGPSLNVFLTKLDSEKIENISITSETVEEEKIWYVSFKRTFDSEYDYLTVTATSPVEATSTEGNERKHGYIEFKNIPMTLYMTINSGYNYVIGENLWRIIPDLSVLNATDDEGEYTYDWDEHESSIELNFSIDETYTNDYGVTTTTSDLYEYTIDSTLAWTLINEYGPEGEVTDPDDMSYLDVLKEDAIIPQFASHLLWNVSWSGDAK